MNKPITISATSIEEYLWQVYRRLVSRHGTSVAAYEIIPLQWYIDTGRASTLLLRALLAAKPFMIARRLHEGSYGTYEAAIDILKDYLGLL